MKSTYDFLGVFMWVQKVIDSCETFDQTIPTRRLINNYNEQMRLCKIDKLTRSNLCDKLYHHLFLKQEKLINE
jgi:hypothetical protein